jgi:ubiquinone/menaquinone biosynthesis C-methylase UbiE
MASSENDVLDRMRDDWNRRAQEDANYYVAFGRHEQDDDEFFSTAADVLRNLEKEMRRMPPVATPRARRALEIGCGPARIMKPLSYRFGEIHGVDVSDEMIRLAREKLRDIPHAHAHVIRGADLAAFADDSFDFVYSYAVFQHIPDRAVVFNYLYEVRRVLKPGGIFRCQFNSLPDTAACADTWSGVRFTAAEVADFTLRNDFQLLALEGAQTQYMWTTWRKRPVGWRPSPASGAHIRRVTNAFSTEPVVPSSGRFALASVWVQGLPDEFDIHRALVDFEGACTRPTYIGHPEGGGLQQVNAPLPSGLRTGLVPVRLLFLEQPVSDVAWMRVIPPGPAVPNVISVADGLNFLSGVRIVSDSIKITLEEATPPFELAASIGGHAVESIDVFLTDPVPPRVEVNLKLPPGLPLGWQPLELRVGKRSLPPISIEVAYPS